jgi:hypothetical protein
VRPLEHVRIRRHAEALQLLEVRAPLAQLIGFLLLVSHHCHAPTALRSGTKTTKNTKTRK